VKHIPDSQIGFLNISEATDEQLKRMRRVGRRPSTGMAKQLIAIRFSPPNRHSLSDPDPRVAEKNRFRVRREGCCR
jgi:hypothetical protein